ncbi:MAG: hypothetical protein M1136_11780 [Chloroflexi bacterium]|nr:hypothetical protein [Chloroflexota bacterium]
MEFDPPQVTIDYTIPLPLEDRLTSGKEVLRINKIGSPGPTAQRTLLWDRLNVRIARVMSGHATIKVTSCRG